MNITPRWLKEMQLPIQVQPVFRIIKRLLRGPTSLEEIAHAKDIVCAEEVVEILPSIFLDGQLEKITGTAEDTILDRQIDAVTRTTVKHEATIAYHIRNVALFNGSLYSGRWKLLVSDPALSGPLPHPSVHLSKAALASSSNGNKYFHHWLCDDCLQYSLAETYGSPLCLPREVTRHQLAYEQYFHQDWRPLHRAVIDELVVFQDFAQTRNKAGRYEHLRQRVREQIEPAVPSSPLVYLRRGSTGKLRAIHNEKEILTALEKRGFEILDISSDTLERILSVLMTARLVVSIEGSHVGHCCMSMPSGGGLLLLQPPNRFIGLHRGWSEALSVRFGFVVGETIGSETHFDTVEISKTIDLFLKKMA